MLDVRLPKKGLDEHFGYGTPLQFDALALYFYANIYNDYKPWYLVEIPYEWANRNWRYWPISKEDVELLSLKQIPTQSDDLILAGSNGVIQFGQMEPVDGLAYKAEEERLKKLQTMHYHSHHKDFDMTKKILLHPPIVMFHEILTYQEGRYKPQRWTEEK